MGSIGSGDGPVNGFCDHGNDTSGSTEDEEVLGHMTDYDVLK
jgi:hypothetical protein